MHKKTEPACWIIPSVAALGVAAGVSGALAQSAQRAAFVANNGNAEGSVTSYTFAPDGAPQFVAKFVTGSGSGNAGNNAYAITLSPDGRYLATTHATAISTFERVTIMRVNADATLALVGTFLTPDSPLAAVWIDNTYLAVTQTKNGGTNLAIVYRFDPAVPSLVEVDREGTGSFTSNLVFEPSRRTLYAPDGGISGGTQISAFRVNESGTLAALGALSTSPYYALGPCVSRSGSRLYGGGGISGGSAAIVGFDIQPDGTLAWMPTAPFTSPGSSPSPKQCVPSRDDRFVFVGHGSSSVVRSFAVGEHGELTDTGFSFDVGIQGDLGGVAVLDELLLFTRKYSTAGPTGLFSAVIQPDGSFAPGAPVSSQGSLPQAIAVWSPPVACYANCDGSTAAPALNVQDFSCFLQKFSSGDGYANCDGSTAAPALNVQDFSCFLAKFAAGCP